MNTVKSNVMLRGKAPNRDFSCFLKPDMGALSLWSGLVRRRPSDLMGTAALLPSLLDCLDDAT
jgi:hypothetical protein